MRSRGFSRASSFSSAQAACGSLRAPPRAGFVPRWLALALLQAGAAAQFTPALPAPSGPHAVGTAVHVLEDPARTYAFEPVRGEARQVLVQLWYPARAQTGTPCPYLRDEGLLDALLRTRFLELEEDVVGAWSDLTAAARENARADGSERLPLLVFAPGFGMPRVSYTALCQELASRGALVALLDPPYAGLRVRADGRVLSIEADPRGPEAAGARVEELARDAAFLLDRLLDAEGPLAAFARRIDPGRVAMLGHSLGGAAALEVGHRDPRFRAAVDLDGSAFGLVEEQGLARPSLVFQNQPERSKRPPPEMARTRRQEWESVAGKQAIPLHLATLADSDHFTFSDLPFLVPPEVRARSGAVLAPARGHAAVARVVWAFLATELELPGAEDPRAAAEACPEVTLERLGG